MASLSPFPKMQFFSGGSPLVGGKLYTYAAGTTTPLATYTDSTGGTPNTNPVIMDARGEASVWLGTSLYYMELRDSTNALIWTADNVGGSATLSDLASTGASSGISLIGNSIQRVANIATLRTIAVTTSRDIETQGYYTAGDGGHGTYYGVTGAAPGAYVDNGGSIIVPTGGDGSSAWKLKKGDKNNILRFGADPTGVSLCNTAIDAAKAFDSTVYFPPGTYRIENYAGLALVVLEGENGSGTNSGPTGPTIIEGSGNIFTNAHDFELRNIVLRNSTAGTAGILIGLANTALGFGIKGCDFGKATYHIYQPNTGGLVVSTSIRDTYFHSATVTSRYYETQLYRYSETSCYTHSNATGLYFAGASTAMIEDSVIQNSGTYGVKVNVPGFTTSAHAIKFKNIHFENNGTSVATADVILATVNAAGPTVDVEFDSVSFNLPTVPAGTVSVSGNNINVIRHNCFQMAIAGAGATNKILNLDGGKISTGGATAPGTYDALAVSAPGAAQTAYIFTGAGANVGLFDTAAAAGNGFLTDKTNSRAHMQAGAAIGATLYSTGVFTVGLGASTQLANGLLQVQANSQTQACPIQTNDTRADATNSSTVQFARQGTVVGSISTTTTATAYNTSSDYRLKLNPQPLTGSGAFIDALQPKTWEWANGSGPGAGFVAHEVQLVSPSSVRGEKDAMRTQEFVVSPEEPATFDDEGNELTPYKPAQTVSRVVPDYQSMEYGSAEFMANIVAELQSLRKRVAALGG